MHPINKKHFGPETGKLQITYHDGTQVVTGHVVKQLGANKFRVSDGTTTKDVLLAQTSELANALTAGYAAFSVETDGGTKFVKKLTAARAVTVDGAHVDWIEHVVATGKGKIARVGDAVSGGGTIPDDGSLLYADFTASKFYTPENS